MCRLRSSFALVVLVVLPGALIAQGRGGREPARDYLRSGPKFLAAFRGVVESTRPSVVRIRCDGKDTALGCIVGADGWVLTKAADLKGSITCVLDGDRTMDAKIVGVHEAHDLALLKIGVFGLLPIKLADSKGTAAGCWVASAGTQRDPVAIGVVSVPTRSVKMRGRPMPKPNQKAGYLGVAVEPADGGVRVVEVMPKTAAAQAGLKVADLIESVDGRAVSDPASFAAALQKRRPGEEVTLKLRRGDAAKELRAKLQKRPASSMRGELQNRMGSELSSRRTGYPVILQHDSVVKPADCGGPLVDLDGRVIGINVSRAGRVETWAVPAEVVRALLGDLKSGKLAPKAVPKAETPAAHLEDAEALLGAMVRRLRLMPAVAHAKWQAKRPVRDARREQEVLERLTLRARERGLDEKRVHEFFAAQIAAARMVQEEFHSRWSKTEKTPVGQPLDLKGELRPRIDRASDELLAAYARLAPHLRDDAVRDHLRRRGSDVLVGPGVTRNVRERALQPLLSR